jgi:hypothetical protein
MTDILGSAACNLLPADYFLRLSNMTPIFFPTQIISTDSSVGKSSVNRIKFHE